MKSTINTLAIMVLVSLTAQFAFCAPPADTIYPMAIMPFQERGTGVKGQGEQVADVVFATLATKPNIWLVERRDLKKILEEAQLSLSGIVSSSQAVKVGQLTGAKILICGSVFKISGKTMIVAKIIGTETSRVFGVSEKGKEGLDELAEKVAQKIAETVKNKGGELMPKPRNIPDVISVLKKQIGDAKKPTVYVSISERHIGQLTIDPAAETEFKLILKKLDFPLTDNKDKADVIISGEGISEFAGRHGNLVSVRSRVEVQATNKTGTVLAVGRQADVAVGLAEQIAGKTALQNAAAILAESIIPKLVGK